MSAAEMTVEATVEHPALASPGTNGPAGSRHHRADTGRSRDVRANPSNSKGRYVETSEYIQAARRFIRGAGRRVALMDLDEIADLADLAGEASAVLDAAVLRLHDECGYSWGEIASRLGITRQSAFRRFGQNGRRRLAGPGRALPGGAAALAKEKGGRTR